MRQVDQYFSHALIKYDGIDFLEKFSDNLALFILDNEHLLQAFSFAPIEGKLVLTSSGFAILSTITKRKLDRTSV